jgi:hypothetical protein
MGWYDYHLHEYIIDNIDYGQPDPDGTFEVKNEKNVKLSKLVLGERAKFTYIYDFGDYWRHKILIEKILPLEITQDRTLVGKIAKLRCNLLINEYKPNKNIYEIII